MDPDPRSSLLLRFDPLTRPSLLNPTHTKSPVQGTDQNKTLTSSDRIDSDDTHLINDLPSNGVLVAVAEDMDNDVNSFMNNIKLVIIEA